MGFRRVPKRIIVRGDEDVARQHVGEADSLLNLCEIQAGFQGLSQFQLVRNLEDGSRIVARMYAGLSDVTIDSPYPRAVERRGEVEGESARVVAYVGNASTGFYFRTFRVNGVPDSDIQWVETMNEMLARRPFAPQKDSYIYMDPEGVGRLDFDDFPPVFWCGSIPFSLGLPAEPCSHMQRIDTEHPLTGEVFENLRTYDGKRVDMFPSSHYVNAATGETWPYHRVTYFDQVTINSYKYHDPVMLPSMTLKRNQIRSEDEYLVYNSKFLRMFMYGWNTDALPDLMYRCGISMAGASFPGTPLGVPEIYIGEANYDWEYYWLRWFAHYSDLFSIHEAILELTKDNTTDQGKLTQPIPYWFESKEGAYPNARYLNTLLHVQARQEYNHRNYPDETTDIILSICRDAKEYNGNIVQVYLAASTDLVLDFVEQGVNDPHYEVVDKKLETMIAASCGRASSPDGQARNKGFERELASLLKHVRDEQEQRGLLVDEDEDYPFLGQLGVYFTDIVAGQNSSDVRQVAMQLLDLTNSLRAQNGKPSVEWDNDLQKACLRHSYDLAKNKVAPPLPHEGTDGSTIGMRAWASGFGAGSEVAHFSVGENLAFNEQGAASAQDIFNAWVGSPLHFANLINEEWRFMAADAVACEGGNIYWCQVFGRNQHRR